ncbi:unnamed protein product, partial [Amoebophrya sp. A25]
WQKLRLDRGQSSRATTEGLDPESSLYADVEAVLVPDCALSVLEDPVYVSRLRNRLCQVPSASSILEQAPSSSGGLRLYVRAMDHARYLFEAAICGKIFVSSGFVEVQKFFEVVLSHVVPAIHAALQSSGVTIIDTQGQTVIGAFLRLLIVLARSSTVIQNSCEAVVVNKSKSTSGANGHSAAVNANDAVPPLPMLQQALRSAGAQCGAQLTAVLHTLITRQRGELRRYAFQAACLLRIDLASAAAEFLGGSLCMSTSPTFLESADVCASLCLIAQLRGHLLAATSVWGRSSSSPGGRLGNPDPYGVSSREGTKSTSASAIARGIDAQI